MFTVALLTLSSGHGGDAAADGAAGDTAVVVLESSSSFSSEEAAAAELSSWPSLRLFITDCRCDDAAAVAEHIADCRDRGVYLWLQKNSVSAGTMFSFSVHDFVDSTSQKSEWRGWRERSEESPNPT